VDLPGVPADRGGLEVAPRSAVSLSGGINKVTVTGRSGRAFVDRLVTRPSAGRLPAVTLEAEDALLGGSATSTGTAVTGIGGPPGNANTLTFEVPARRAGTYAMRVRYANPEQSPATHYNPDPLARHADITVNGGPVRRVLFPHTFHVDNFWDLTVPVTLRPGRNTIRFAAEELPNFDGTTYASETFPGVLLRSAYAPVVDRIQLSPFTQKW
jgi:hypothetical protein